MFRRQAILTVSPKTTVQGFYRSDAFLIAFIPIILLLLLFLPSCQSGQRRASVKFYRTLRECVTDRISLKDCKEAWDQARREHLQNGLSYPSKAECERVTQDPCELITSDKGLVYKPVMQGFLVEKPARGIFYIGTHTRYVSHPVYGRASGYWLSNRESLRVSDDGTATVNSKRSVTRGFGSSFRSSKGRSSSS